MNTLKARNNTRRELDPQRRSCGHPVDAQLVNVADDLGAPATAGRGTGAGSGESPVGVASTNGGSQPALSPSTLATVLLISRGTSASHVEHIEVALESGVAPAIAVAYAFQMSKEALSPQAAADLLASGLADLGYARQSQRKIERDVRRLGRYLALACGHVDVRNVRTADLAAWVSAPLPDGEQPASSTRQGRRHVARVFFDYLQRLGLTAGNPAIELEAPARNYPTKRPLLDHEMRRAELAAHDTLLATRMPACLALAQATATTHEMGRVRHEDVDIQSRTVRLCGGKATLPRSGHLTDWGVTHLRRRLEELDASGASPVVYEGHGDSESMQASCSIALRSILDRAGVSKDPLVGPASVRAWAGRRAYDEAGRIEDAARALGCRSLDTAARLIGLDWMADQ